MHLARVGRQDPTLIVELLLIWAVPSDELDRRHPGHRH